jgi:hypothetical protein
MITKAELIDYLRDSEDYPAVDARELVRPLTREDLATFDEDDESSWEDKIQELYEVRSRELEDREYRAVEALQDNEEYNQIMAAEVVTP